MRAIVPSAGYPIAALLGLMLVGCASYQPEPLAATHPANPAAPRAPVRAPSRTLAYAPSDVPESRPASPPSTTSHGEHAPRSVDNSGAPMVVGKGEVVSTVPRANQIVVDHEAIEGFMDAMTMGYRVDPPSLLEGLQPGDRIRFTIDVRRRAIVAIERLG